MGKITEEMPMNITVYLGANEGSDPALKQAVEELGRWIGESGNALVYGGSRSGLMGRLAHSVLTPVTSPPAVRTLWARRPIRPLREPP